MPRIRRRQNYHLVSDFYRGRIVAYRNVGLFYREIDHYVNCTTMMVCRVRTEEGREIQKRPTDQSWRTTQRQDRRFRRLALRDGFATTSQIVDELFEEEGRPVTIRILNCRIRAFGLF